MMTNQVEPTWTEVEYYGWLVNHIRVGPPKKEYYGLFEILHNTEFTWFIPNDDNRVNDGRGLRNHFMRSVHNRRYEEGDLNIMGVSTLEVLVALSERLEFIAGGNAPDWAWQLLKNLGLNKASDPLSAAMKIHVKTVLDDLIWRQYEPNGQGGFFPLRSSVEDQTKVEIWYQMQAYVMEIEDMD